MRYKIWQKISNLSSPDSFFQAQSAPKSVFGRGEPRTPLGELTTPLPARRRRRLELDSQAPSTQNPGYASGISSSGGGVAYVVLAAMDDTWRIEMKWAFPGQRRLRGLSTIEDCYLSDCFRRHRLWTFSVMTLVHQCAFDWARNPNLYLV